MIDHDFLVQDFLYISGTGRVVFQKEVTVKDNTLVDTIIRNPAVQDAAVHINDIPRHRDEAFFVLSDGEGTFQDSDDFIFDMPVVRHDIARMVRFNMVKFKRKVISSSETVFVTVKIVQNKFLPVLSL